jgi:hypothetical protein
LDETRLHELSEQFKNFAQYECRNSSPLYEALALRIAKDEGILRLVESATHGPVPNLFFAAVHFFLLNDSTSRLSRYYADLSNTPAEVDHAFPDFRSFCSEMSSEISTILQTRLVQTNEPRRSALLLPAFELVAKRSRKPLELIEVGASAGLNLLWNRYSYDYGTGTIHGRMESKLRINCQARGKNPLLSDNLPEVEAAVGIDLNPLYPSNKDDALWLEALVWPEHKERRAILKAAIEEARNNPPRVFAGDALEILPKVLSSSTQPAKCIFSTFTLNQLTEMSREKLQNIVSQASMMRDIYFVSIPFTLGTYETDLGMTVYKNGAGYDQILARVDPHGSWIELL